MTTEFTVAIADVPGSLARLGQILGDAGVNIEAIQGFVGGGHGLVRFVPDTPEPAARALDAEGYAHTRREVLVVRVLDEAGALGQLALVLAEADINIDAIYVTTRGHLVLGVDDLTGAIHVAAGMALMIGD